MDLFCFVSILFALYLWILILVTICLGFSLNISFFVFLSIALLLIFRRFVLIRQDALIHGIGRSHPLNRWILSHTTEFNLNELSFIDLSKSAFADLQKGFKERLDQAKRFQISDQFVILTIAYANNSETGTYLADIQNKPIQCLTRSFYQIEKKDFKQLGTVAKPLWNQFKDACVRDLCSQMEERDQKTEKQKIEQQELEQKIAAKLNIVPSTQGRKSSKPCPHPESKRIDQGFFDQLSSLFNDPHTSPSCRNSIVQLLDDCRDLNDPHWVQRCNSYYLPEILNLFSQMNKTSNWKFKQDCMFLIDDFEKNLRKIVEQNKKNEECLDQRVQISVFKQMMVMDGLTPDEIQKKMKR